MKKNFNVILALILISISSNIEAAQNMSQITKAYKDELITPQSSVATHSSIPKRTLLFENENLILVDVHSVCYPIPLVDSITNQLYPPINEYIDETIVIQFFDPENLNLLNTKYIDLELPVFGGFFSTPDFYFVISACPQQQNISVSNGIYSQSWQENEYLEVIRIDKYNKDFKLLNSASIIADEANIVEPFKSGNVAIAILENELLIHTSRTVFKDSSGQNKQAQFTFAVDINSMLAEVRLAGNSDWKQPNHVNQSLNQFVEFDGSQAILLDHGNASPREIILTKYDKGDAWSDETITVFQIPGQKNAAHTGLTIGGFEIANSSYLTAINSIDYDPRYQFTDLGITGLEKEERNIILYITKKDSYITTSVNFTSYADTNKLGGTPKLIPISNNKFMLMWIEFDECTYEKNIDGGIEISANKSSLKYVLINDYGSQLTDIQTFPEGNLSQFVQPICIDNEVVWIAGQHYYSIDL